MVINGAPCQAKPKLERIIIRPCSLLEWQHLIAVLFVHGNQKFCDSTMSAHQASGGQQPAQPWGLKTTLSQWLATNMALGVRHCQMCETILVCVKSDPFFNWHKFSVFNFQWVCLLCVIVCSALCGVSAVCHANPNATSRTQPHALITNSLDLSHELFLRRHPLENARSCKNKSDQLMLTDTSHTFHEVQDRSQNHSWSIMPQRLKTSLACS